MADVWRLFIAIELPPPVRAELEQLQTRLKSQGPSHAVRWVAFAGIHLTLKFLGDAPIDQRETLQKELALAVQNHAPFELSTSTLGCFPNAHRPRVVWLGLQGHLEALRALQQAVEVRIAPLGYPTENRPFSPHLTLGRVRPEAKREDVSRLSDLISRAPAGSTHTWSVDQVTLFRSELKPSGALYTPLFHAPLS